MTDTRPAVLCLDDSATVHACMAAQLEPQMSYRGVRTWTEALSSIRHGAPDVILVDLDMEGFRGEDVLGFLDRCRSFIARTRVLVFSAHSEEEIRSRVAGLRIDGILPKTFDPTMMVKLRQALTVSRRTPSA